MKPEDLFILKYQHCEEILKNTTIRAVSLPKPSLDCLALSATIRLFLLDDHPLVTLVNRERKFKLRFQIGPSTRDVQRSLPSILNRPGVFFVRGGIPPGQERSVKLDAFLSHTMLIGDDKHFSVLEIIKMVTNKLGGVHYDPQDNDERQGALREIQQTFRIADEGPLLVVIQAIAFAMITGLRPLYDAIIAERSPAIDSG